MFSVLNYVTRYPYVGMVFKLPKWTHWYEVIEIVPTKQSVVSLKLRCLTTHEIMNNYHPYNTEYSHYMFK